MKRITITLGDAELQILHAKSRELGTSIADLVRRCAQQVASSQDDAAERRISERILAAEERMTTRINLLVSSVRQVIISLQNKEVSK